MNNIRSIIDKNNLIHWYNWKLRDLKDYVEHGDDEETIKDFKCKIEEYEKCIKELKKDIMLIELGF